jgi:hypothetical protein
MVSGGDVPPPPPGFTLIGQSAIDAQIAKTKAGLATQSQYNDTNPSLVGGFQSEMQKNPIVHAMFPPATNPATGHRDPYGVERGVAMALPEKFGPAPAESLFDQLKGKLTTPPPVEAPAVNKWMGVAEKDLAHGGNPGQRIVDEKLLGATKQETQANIQPKLAEASDDLHRYLQGAGAQGVEIDAHPLIDKALNEAHANLRSPTDEAFARSVAAIKGKIEARFPQYDISKLTPEQAHEVKVYLGKQIDWTDPVRNPINDALQDIYHGLNNEIDTKVVDVKPIQKRWGDLFTADQRLDKSIRKDAVGSGTGSAVPTSPSMADKLKEFGLKWAVPTGGAAGALYGLYKKFED